MNGLHLLLKPGASEAAGLSNLPGARSAWCWVTGSAWCWVSLVLGQGVSLVLGHWVSLVLGQGVSLVLGPPGPCRWWWADGVVCPVQVDPEEYVDTCLYLYCSLGPRERDNSTCDTLASYARECAQHHVIISWRGAQLCGRHPTLPGLEPNTSWSNTQHFLVQHPTLPGLTPNTSWSADGT